MFYQLCVSCNRQVLSTGPSTSGVLCFGCFQNQAGYKSYADNVILVKPEVKMNNEQSPESEIEKHKRKVQEMLGTQNQVNQDHLQDRLAQTPLALGQEQNGQGKGKPGVKDDGGKLMWNLLPWKAVQGMVKVLTFGAQKYSSNGWRAVPNAKERYQAALLRHLFALNAGEKVDPESKLRHIDHVLCNVAFLAELED